VQRVVAERGDSVGTEPGGRRGLDELGHLDGRLRVELVGVESMVEEDPDCGVARARPRR